MKGCNGCRYYVRKECHRRAPLVVVDPREKHRFIGHFPYMLTASGCGEYEAIPVVRSVEDFDEVERDDVVSDDNSSAPNSEDVGGVVYVDGQGAYDIDGNSVAVDVDKGDVSGGD